MRARIQDALQALPVERRLDLFRVGRRNRCHRIRVDNAALQQVRILIGLQLIRCEIIIRQTGDRRHNLRIPFSLESQIMDRHDRLDPAVEFIFLEASLQVDRDQTCLPVMAVNQVRTEAKRRKRGKDSLRKIRKALDLEQCVVRVDLLR